MLKLQGIENGGERGLWGDEDHGVGPGQGWVCDLGSTAALCVLPPATCMQGNEFSVCREKVMWFGNYSDFSKNWDPETR